MKILPVGAELFLADRQTDVLRRCYLPLFTILRIAHKLFAVNADVKMNTELT